MTNTNQQWLNDYSLKPLIFDAARAIEDQIISYDSDENLTLNLNANKIILSPHQQYNMVLPTIFGLNEALVQAEKGQSLRKDFEKEFALFNNYFETDGHIKKYGNYVYYPDRKHIVQYAPEFWHRLSLIASNAELIKDPTNQYDWKKQRQIFDHCRIAVAGASVGSKIADALLKVIRPKEMIIADPAVYKLTNANRTDISYDDIIYSQGLQNDLIEKNEFSPYGMKNKAISFALKTQKIDPYLTIYPIVKGITIGNVAEFVSSADVIVEEVDMSYDLEIKVAIRAEARRQKKLFCMISDLGSWVQWDIRPFHLNDKLPLFIHCTDEKIFLLNQMARESKDNFYRFMEGLIDTHFWSSGEFGETLSGQLPKIVGSMPQLGSTTSIAAGLGAEFISRILLGHLNIYEQGIVDLKKQEIRTFGKPIGETYASRSYYGHQREL